jgi:hypothetical protein
MIAATQVNKWNEKRWNDFGIVSKMPNVISGYAACQ